jgi:hypothetical protein
VSFTLCCFLALPSLLLLAHFAHSFFVLLALSPGRFTICSLDFALRLLLPSFCRGPSVVRLPLLFSLSRLLLFWPHQATS